MKLLRTFRDAAALYALVSVLFMQLALAFYSCPEFAATSTTPVLSDVPLDGMPRGSMGSDCTGADLEQPGLCQAHAQAGNQSVGKQPPPDVPPFAAVGSFIEITIRWSVDVVHPPIPALLTRVTAPPIAIRNCCFRI